MAAAQIAPPINIAVDATEAARGIFHSHLTIPAKPGAMTLVYPKWIPGDHAPDGPIVNVVGLKLSASGKPIPWKRDDVDMFAFHFDVPGGVSEIEASFDALCPANSSTTPNLAILEWNQVVLYPKGKASDDVTFSAKLRLPAGWKSATALPSRRRLGRVADLQPGQSHDARRFARPRRHQLPRSSSSTKAKSRP